MRLAINKNLPIPIYYQIEEGIKALIEQRELKPGDLIPSERELCEAYGISRMTVRQAVNNLVNDGYLVRQQGRGTFVSKGKMEQRLKGVTSFSEDMRARGMEPGTKLLSFERIQGSKSICEKFSVPEGTMIFEVKRVRLADGIPMAYEISYLPATLLPGFTLEVAEGSIYQFVENVLMLEIGNAHQVLEASLARGVECEILGLESGAPVLLIQRQTYLADGVPLEVVRSVYPGDRYKFVIDMQRTVS
ncbi:GntR family transcriptional regulator [Ammoniphilus sp. CFH 90114]|uniref:GntR family transcriptional regulator n=1 Tax=Ammoniphilus sp. CFH 90114 TaxID=2493665 RepID=UPI00100E000A|nr:GntR family transcriptional regulator [Ammoniphilus sp. CFH 90114]RXT04374.1 GntR family transcriptional regulator [Ammoniphilus sp. CFH 90114]